MMLSSSGIFGFLNYNGFIFVHLGSQNKSGCKGCIAGRPSFHTFQTSQSFGNEKPASIHEKAILEVLDKAAVDPRFLARLAENPFKVLQEFALNEEERAALAIGDIRKIESWVGELDQRRKTWLTVRLSQDKW